MKEIPAEATVPIEGIIDGTILGVKNDGDAVGTG